MNTNVIRRIQELGTKKSQISRICPTWLIMIMKLNLYLTEGTPMSCISSGIDVWKCLHNVESFYEGLYLLGHVNSTVYLMQILHKNIAQKDWCKLVVQVGSLHGRRYSVKSQRSFFDENYEDHFHSSRL